MPCLSQCCTLGERSLGLVLQKPYGRWKWPNNNCAFTKIYLGHSPTTRGVNGRFYAKSLCWWWGQFTDTPACWNCVDGLPSRSEWLLLQVSLNSSLKVLNKVLRQCRSRLPCALCVWSTQPCNLYKRGKHTCSQKYVMLCASSYFNLHILSNSLQHIVCQKANSIP